MKVNQEMIRALLNGKKGKIIVIITGIAGMLLILISELIPNGESRRVESSVLDITSDTGYEEMLEERLTELISSIDGAGKTKVMITLENTSQYIYAEDEKKDDSSTESKIVTIDADEGEKALVKTSIEPQIRGVAVVCEGGDDETVVLRIQSAVKAALGISSRKIYVTLYSKD